MSDEDSPGLPRNKTLTFTLEERKLLLTLINKHYQVVHNKKVDSKSTNQKNQAWESIHQEFNFNSETARYPRTPQQLKRCWENLRCKGKKGDTGAVKLLRWADKQHQMDQTNGAGANGDDETSEPMLDSNSDDRDEDDDDKQGYNNQLKDNDSLEETIEQLTASASCTHCQHCQCDRAERMAKLRLYKLEQQGNERLHAIKVRHLKAKAKRGKELHRLAVHEMALRVENERRRADILEKELSRQL